MAFDAKAAEAPGGVLETMRIVREAQARFAQNGNVAQQLTLAEDSRPMDSNPGATINPE